MTDETKRAAVFVDGSNFYHAMKKVRYQIGGFNYTRLSQNLCHEHGCGYKQTLFYIVEVKLEGNTDLYRRQQRFFDQLEKQDRVAIRKGRVERVNEKWREKGVDVMLAVDMVSMAYDNKYDVAFLLSTDGDFTPAAEKVRELGKRVIVASFFGSEALEGSADFMRLEDKHFRSCWNF